MTYIAGARLEEHKAVRVALTNIYGIGQGKAVQLANQLGISKNVKVHDLTKYQIDQLEELISQNHVIRWELKRREAKDIKRLISISSYRGIRHQKGLPLRGQRTHTNARTSRKRTQPRA